MCICWSLDGSSKLLEASIESKRKEEKDLHEQDIMAHRRLRDATAAAAVECKQHVENCQENLTYLKKQVYIIYSINHTLCNMGQHIKDIITLIIDDNDSHN